MGVHRVSEENEKRLALWAMEQYNRKKVILNNLSFDKVLGELLKQVGV